MSEGAGVEVKPTSAGAGVVKESETSEAAKQKVVTPEYMFFEAPRERAFITGSEAAKEAIRRANVDVAISYPITPQSETMQQVGALWAEGYVKEYYRGEEEIGVMSAIAGSSRAGARSLTATAGPGLMRGMEVVASWPGGRMPIVLLIMCRVINAPLSIQPDNAELAYLINTGNIVFHAENQQDFFDYTLKAFIISERPEVTLPVAVAVDGFFVTHARGYVMMPSKDIKLPPRDPYHEAVPVMDNENPPARLSRDAPIQKSNFISYHVHASWQQEVWAAVERSRKYIDLYMGGLVEIVNPDADTIVIASGSAVSQSREAVRQAEEDLGERIGLIKIRSLRPFPTKELRDACKNAKRIIVPEFNCVGWLYRDVAAALYGYSKAEIIPGPRVFGGISLPTEMILQYIFPDKKFVF
ncbi:transketolase C-terminal domain-containing protein [Leptospirillum ferrooxidans]|jgi:pyruvate ferredoxin oxidoreductase alpha subunit|uniref:Pyruvate synthase, alpha subunit n=1 Tax=Leptospirillum ferrooxidans (strain C2-3) TaxID=1162668 RepID=I0IRW2_LEPFC|nr:transketolase C-terminal domain-containing protein [Leptospirillum ferrooxidans]BAM08011.1 pyruvate synthase, alpha subunit [Leptospirillum ferrooxidans C2-3]